MRGAAFAAAAALGGAMLVIWGGAVLVAERRRAAATAYLRDDGPGLPDEFAQRLSEPFRRRVVSPLMARLADAASRITPAEHRSRLEDDLVAAGMEARRADEIVVAEGFGAVVGLAVGGALVAFGSASIGAATLTTVLLVLVGFAAPQAWLSHQAGARREAIRRDLPDTLDLLAISVEAGIGLEGAMAVVSERMDSPLADELERTLQELGLGLTRHDALTNLRDRSSVTELTRFVQALIQADQLGMPIGGVLKVQADEMRSRQRQWARERSAKLPVKILFPLVACIFPAVLVIILGPAVSSMVGSL